MFLVDGVQHSVVLLGIFQYAKACIVFVYEAQGTRFGLFGGESIKYISACSRSAFAVQHPAIYNKWRRKEQGESPMDDVPISKHQRIATS